MRRKSLLNSFKYAFEGIWYCFTHERNFLIHIFSAIGVLYFAFQLKLETTRIIILIFVIGLVIICEMINTAVEKTIDELTLQLHPYAKIAKDVAAGAVLVSAIIALITGGLIFMDSPNVSSMNPNATVIFLLLIVLAYFFIYVMLFPKKPEKKDDSPDLVDKATKVMEKSYAPYSKYKAGAAIKSDSGKIFVGCNVENSSLGNTCCAERVALYRAVSEGEKNFTKIAVVSSGKHPAVPCGLCRQALMEFSPKMEVVVLEEKDGKKSMKKFAVDKLIPDSINNLKVEEKEKK